MALSGPNGTGSPPYSYTEAIGVLNAAVRFGIHPSLEYIRALTATLDRPQDAYACIQITGTNGKSSTTRMAAALLAAHGHRTGTYTSPELESMTERIELDGTPVSEADFARAVFAASSAEHGAREAGVLPHDARVTQFELLTTAALWLFRECDVNTACLEVGMGGRWDATSVVSPAVAVITGVALDHTDRLGTTREAIAEDKAHIIKQGSIVVLGPGTAGVEEVILARAEACGARVCAVRAHGAPSPVAESDTVRFEVTARPTEPGGFTTLDAAGAHGAYRGLRLRAPAYQAENAATALAAAQAALGRALDVEAARAAFAALVLPGRFELVRAVPPVVLDGAHNPQAAGVLATAIADAWPEPDKRPALLLGILSDKDAPGIVEALAEQVGEIAVTRSASARALPAEELARIVADVTGREPRVFADVRDALESLVANCPRGLVVTGSITTAGEARGALRAFC